MYTDMKTISYFETADDHYESDDFTLCYLIMKQMMKYVNTDNTRAVTFFHYETDAEVCQH